MIWHFLSAGDSRFCFRLMLCMEGVTFPLALYSNQLLFYIGTQASSIYYFQKNLNRMRNVSARFLIIRPGHSSRVFMWSILWLRHTAWTSFIRVVYLTPEIFKNEPEKVSPGRFCRLGLYSDRLKKVQGV